MAKQFPGGDSSSDLKFAAPLSVDERRVERIISTARALLAASLVGAITGASGTFVFSYVYWVIVPGYCTYSIALIALFRRQPLVSRRMRMAAHVADLVWAAVLIMLFDAVTPHTPFLVFLIFPLLAAAMRWGFRATMATAGITVLLLVPLTWTANWPISSVAKELHHPEYNIVSIGSALLLIAGFLMGYFGEYEGQLRSDASAVARVAGQAHRSVRPDETVTAVFNELSSTFEPAQVQLALHEIPTGQIHVWQLNRSRQGHDEKVIRHELDFSHQRQLFWAGNNDYMLGSRSDRQDGVFNIRIYSPSGKMTGENTHTFTNTLFPKEFSSFICVPLVFGDEWEVRIFLWEPAVRRLNRRTVRAVAEASDRLGPMIFAAALQQYLGSRATVDERARFARELHDGIMQSLAAVDFKIASIIEKLDRERHQPIMELVWVQQTIRGEVSSLRELIHHNRVVEVGPARLLPFLSETVSRFQTDIGITARLICELDEVKLPSSTCYEVARIVQEALANVRKHSAASNVAVRFSESGDRYLLVITDDGNGFDFVGRYTFEQLDAVRKGPFVIKERVRSISGDMTIESFPERGTRVEITFPREQK